MKMTNRLVRCVFIAGVSLVTPMAFAQTSTGAATAPKQDTMFVTKASAGGATEIQASQLADAQAQSDQVKQFASTMVADHTKAGDMLSSVAQKNGFAVSASPTPAQQKKLQQLQALKGTAFDKAYTAMMLKDHRETVALFKKEAAAGQNSDLKSFASETLPTLEHHLAMAEKL